MWTSFQYFGNYSPRCFNMTMAVQTSTNLWCLIQMIELRTFHELEYSLLEKLMFKNGHMVGNERSNFLLIFGSILSKEPYKSLGVTIVPSDCAGEQMA